MKTCSACGHTQEDGVFCGKCGTKLEVHTDGAVNKQPNVGSDVEQGQSETAAGEEAREAIHEAEKNEQLEKVKEESKKYFNYFMQQLKAPSAQIHEEQSSFKMV